MSGSYIRRMVGSALDDAHNRSVRERIAEIDGFLIPPAAQRLSDAQRVLRLSRGGAIAGMILLPLGIIGTGLAMIGGLPHELANIVSTLGLGAGGVGGALKFFFCSPSRVRELEERARAAQQELDALNYEREALLRTIR